MRGEVSGGDRAGRVNALAEEAERPAPRFHGELQEEEVVLGVERVVVGHDEIEPRGALDDVRNRPVVGEVHRGERRLVHIPHGQLTEVAAAGDEGGSGACARSPTGVSGDEDPRLGLRDDGDRDARIRAGRSDGFAERRAGLVVGQIGIVDDGRGPVGAKVDERDAVAGRARAELAGRAGVVARTAVRIARARIEKDHGISGGPSFGGGDVGSGVRRPGRVALRTVNQAEESERRGRRRAEKEEAAEGEVHPVAHAGEHATSLAKGKRPRVRFS